MVKSRLHRLHIKVQKHEEPPFLAPPVAYIYANPVSGEDHAVTPQAASLAEIEGYIDALIADLEQARKEARRKLS